VKLTHPSTFLSRSQYQQFVYAALVDVLDDGEEIVCERGSIFMPKLGVELWTGKQVGISFNNVSKLYAPDSFCFFGVGYFNTAASPHTKTILHAQN